MSLWNVLSDWPNREDGPDLKAVLDQNLALLDFVRGESGSKARELGARLRAKPDADYRSARLELLIAQAFREAGFEIEWDPHLPATRKSVEFRARRGGESILVEARLSGPERVISDHWDITWPLTARIDGLKLPCQVMLHWQRRPPPLGALNEMWPSIESQLTNLCGGASSQVIEVSWRGSEYRLVVEVVGPGEGVIPSTGLLRLDSATKIRQDILRKASRYGLLQEPFVIVVWSDAASLDVLEVDALYGSRKWEIHPEGAREKRVLDGLFTELDEDGMPRVAGISAVAALRTGSYVGTLNDSFVVYHNPHATYPLDPDALVQFPQFIFSNGRFSWRASSQRRGLS